MAARAHRFKPPAPVSLGGYELDAFVVESHDDSPVLSFRFHLGEGLGIYWALPAAPNNRLRLFHVDGAAYTVDEPELIEDPFCFDLPQLHWRERAELSQGRRLVSVTVDALAKPSSYRCELVVEQGDGQVQTNVLGWPVAR